MENTLPQAISPSELAPVNGTGATPFSQQTVVLTKQAYIELTWQANYWRGQKPRVFEGETAPEATGGKPSAPIPRPNPPPHRAQNRAPAGWRPRARAPAGHPPNRGAQPGN